MKKEIQRCIDVLRTGGTILYPTDTIWGIGCDATDPEAVSKIYRIKKRKDSKAMLVLVDSIERIYDCVREVPEMALEILEQTREGGSLKPLTIIYPGAFNLASNLPADDGSIGIRVSTDPFSRELIRMFGKPLVSTSANIAGSVPPANFGEISDEIRSAVDYVADWRRDERKKARPSGILKVSLNGEIIIIRE